MKEYIFSLLEQEEQRQESTLNLIASENYASPDILRAAGSVLTNKYAEGYPGKRYYGGCDIVDMVEVAAQEAGKKLFGADHINVQSHAGAIANFAVYLSCLKPGDTVMGMNLAAGGHLTHGYHANFSGIFYKFVSYGVHKDTECLDYDEIERLAQEHKPKLIVAGASAYSRLIDFERMAKIAKSVGALLLVDMAHFAGLVAGNVIPSPIPWADIVSSTSHKTLRGPRGAFICCKSSQAKAIDKAVMPGCQGGPLMHIIAAKAIAFAEALEPSFEKYAKNIIINAKAMAKTFQKLGYRIVSDGTDTHLFLIDLSSKGLTGKEIESVLSSCNIIVNRNSIPFDTQSPLVTSGIRIGTPAITTRGFDESHAISIATLIHEAIIKRSDPIARANIKEKVLQMCKQFPVYNK
jgi:glycine hydroxymethyltransferase